MAVTLITKSDQIGVNRTKSEIPSTKSEIPSTKSGTFFGLAFFLMLIYRELNFDTDCFNAYVTSCLVVVSNNLLVTLVTQKIVVDGPL